MIMTTKLRRALLVVAGGLVGLGVFAYEVAKQTFGLGRMGARAIGMFGLTFVVWFAYIFLTYPERSRFWKNVHLAFAAVLSLLMLVTWDWKEEKFDLVVAGDPIRALQKNKNCEGSGWLGNLDVVGDKLVNPSGVALFSIREINDSKLELSGMNADVVVMVDVAWYPRVFLVSSQLPAIGWKSCDR
jgi:hypothetical protein